MDYNQIIDDYEAKIASLEQEVAARWKTHQLAITAAFFFVAGLCIGAAL